MDLKHIHNKYKTVKCEYDGINHTVKKYQTGQVKLDNGYAEYLLLEKERRILGEYMMLLAEEAKMCKGD